MALIAPALFEADFARLGEALDWIARGGARRVHLHVADGHVQPEITVGPAVVGCLRKRTRLFLDVHLAIERSERYVADFAAAGADAITIQAESTRDLAGVLGLVRAHGKETGVALNPATPVDWLAEIGEGLDLVTILSADRSAERGGPGGTASWLAKLREAVRLRAERGFSFAVQAEGDVNGDNLAELAAAGADILVAGAAIFENRQSDDAKGEDRLGEWMAVVAGSGERSRTKSGLLAKRRSRRRVQTGSRKSGR